MIEYIGAGILLAFLLYAIWSICYVGKKLDELDDEIRRRYGRLPGDHE